MPLTSTENPEYVKELKLPGNMSKDDNKTLPRSPKDRPILVSDLCLIWEN
jgi:hypothetical protein